MAEALRLRAVARAQKGLLAVAIADAEDALALDTEAAGVIPAADLRLLAESWKRLPDRSSLLGR